MLRCISRLGQGWVLGASLVVSMLGFASTATAQFDRGSISGTIKDASGGVVPGVTVTATSVQTQTPTVAVTDATGFYTFPNLRPGQYVVNAELEGFKKIVRENLQLDAGGALTIDFALETGAITEQVTVTAETPLLQSDVAIRKVVDAKDIEQLSFSGRNPIGVASLKAGVVGGSFNTRGFADLGNGGFNINGSRSDENNITVDGATAIRTRSSGAIIGIQNVDAIQEVQVLTANYMPEFGRSSGGQIRFVTKSGSNRFSGSASFFYQDDSLNANSWSRNRSTNPVENSGPAPFDQKQYGYSFGGPIPLGMFKDKLFFFGAQEWVNFYRDQTAIITVPTAAMRNGDFSELLNPGNGFFSGARVINDPLTGQPFPGNVIPADRLSPNGKAILNAYPMPTPGFRQGSANAIITSPNPQDQRKDNIRFDYRLNEKNNISYRFGRYNWVAVDAFRGDLPFARTDWERPNYTNTASWTSTLTSNLINELTYTYSRDDVFINVFQEGDLYKRSNKGINYPYIFQEKEIADKIPTVSFGSGGFREMDGGPYPASSSGPITTVSNTTTWVRGRHTLKAGVQVEYSGEDDFDQINVSAIPGSTNNQNGRFEFLDNRSGGTGLAISNAALGLYSNYAELGQRNFTKWRSLATDVFVQDSWKPTSQLTIEGGFRWVLWPPWYSTTNNIANFDPNFYDPAQAPIVNPANGTLTGGNRYNGIVLPGDGFEGDGGAGLPPTVNALFRGEPRGFSETHYNVFEPRLGLSYQLNEKTVLRASGGIFHNRVTLNDSTLLGGNPPFQPQATVSNGLVDNPAGGTAGAQLPFGINGQDAVFKHPTSYMWGVGIQREIPFGITVDITYLGRRGLYLQRERNINQLQPGTLQANPGVNIAALRPFKGYNVIRLSENAGKSRYNSLQISADRRYRNGLKLGFAYTLGKSEDNASNKRNVLWNSYDDTGYFGPSDYDRRHVASVYYIYDLPFMRDQSTLMRNLLGGWQVSGATFFRTGTPFAVLRGNDIAGVGDGGFLQPYNLVGDVNAGANKEFSTAVGDGNFWFNPAAFAAPAAGTFGNAPRNNIYNPGEQQWDIAIFKNFNLGGTRRAQFRAEFFNFPNHPNWANVQTGALQGQGWADPTSGNFGRVTSKTGERTAQLSLRFLF
jgi:Carboxypeptidase regulatory-like domain